MNQILYLIGRLLTWLRHDDLGAEQSRGRRLAGGATLWLSILYVVGLAALLLAMHLYTDRVWIWSALVFLPPLGWLLPILALTPLALFFRPVALVPQLLAALILLIGYLDFNINLQQPPPPDDGVGLRIVSNNIGSAMGTSPLAFIQAQEADLVALQENHKQEPFAPEVFADYHLAMVDEYLLWSRWPIVEQELLDDLVHRKQPIAARFVVDTGSQRFVVYNVHLPSRQWQLNALRVGGLIPGGAEPTGIWSAAERQRFRETLGTFRELAAELASRIAAEELPVLAVGDFNMPDRGAIYRTFADDLVDAHEVAGSGYGFTVPASAPKAIALWQPWLRIDYIFVGEAWNVLGFHTEGGRGSQHRAVAARLQLPTLSE